MSFFYSFLVFALISFCFFYFKSIFSLLTFFFYFSLIFDLPFDEEFLGPLLF